MAIATRGTASNYLQRAPSPSGLVDVVDLILDKGLVIDAYIRISVIGIELVTIDARIVIASIDSYLRFAEDYDGDGRRDIWSTPADIFASIANYLSSRGWIDGETWGREVKVTPDAAQRIRTEVAPRSGTCAATRAMIGPLPADRWQKLGVRLPGGRPVPKGDGPTSLVSGSERHFLVTPSYDAILDYNCSHAYAITVGLLSDAIASKTPIPAARAKAAPRPARRRAKG